MRSHIGVYFYFLVTSSLKAILGRDTSCTFAYPIFSLSLSCILYLSCLQSLFWFSMCKSNETKTTGKIKILIIPFNLLLYKIYFQKDFALIILKILSKLMNIKIYSYFVVEDTNAQRKLTTWSGTWGRGLKPRQVGFPLQLSTTVILQCNQKNIGIYLVRNEWLKMFRKWLGAPTHILIAGWLAFCIPHYYNNCIIY